MGRAVIYTRVSTQSQEDGYSLSVQERDGRSYCDAQGHTVVAVQSDTFTGHDSLDERAGMQAAIQLIKHGQADTLVIWRVDRAGRFMLDNMLLHREVYEAGGVFASVTEGVIPNTPLGKLMLSVYSFAGETEWEGIRDRTQAGITARIDAGHIIPAPVPLYGYVWIGDKKQTYAIDPDAAPVVQTVYAKADAGWSSRRIARWLNEQGIPTASKLLFQRGEMPKPRPRSDGTTSTPRPVAEEWSTQAVLAILRQESYTGKHVARRYSTEKVKIERDGRMVTTRRRAESDGRRVALTIPPLISEELWARVQEHLTLRHAEPSEPTEDAPLLARGYAVCGVCGGRMVTVHRAYWSEPRYMCTNRTLGCAGGGFAVKVAEVDADTWNKAKDIVRDESRFTRLIEGKSSKLAARHQEAVDRVALVSRELTETRAQQAVVYARMTAETDDTIYAMHRVELQRLNEALAGLERRVSEAQGAVEAVQGRQDVHRALLLGITSLLKRDGYRDLAERYLVERGIDPSKAPQLMAGLHATAEEVSLDSLDREGRRGVLRLLGARVVMYPVNSDFNRDNGRRTDFTFAGCVHSGEVTAGPSRPVHAQAPRRARATHR